MKKKLSMKRRIGKWLSLLWCRIRRHELARSCNCGGLPVRCRTCIRRELAAAYEPDAYQVGQHLYSHYGEVVVKRITSPTTKGSKAWLMTESLEGMRYGAPDTYFSPSKDVEFVR